MEPSINPSSFLLSIPASQLDIASAVEVDLELKFDWEDHAILSGDRPLNNELKAASINPDRIVNVHLPPGTRTRGRAIGMAATDANLGTILDFVHVQLAELPDTCLVMHPPRTFNYGDQLSLFSRLCDLSGHRITIENPPGESYWATPEDIAFFGFIGSTYPEWSDLYLTVDSKHLKTGRPPEDPLDPEAVDDLFGRLEDVDGLDVTSLRKAFCSHLTMRINQLAEDADRLPTDGWTPLLNTLVLTGDRVWSIHFNDPVDDGIPDLDGHETSQTLAAVRRLVRLEDVTLVLEPNRETYDHPGELRRKIDSVESWLAGDT